MAALLFKRVVESIFSLVCLVCAVFVVARMTGDPGKLYLPVTATDQMISDFNKLHGFDQPIWKQFIDFAIGLLRLDFGASLRRQQPALNVVLEAYPTTLQLVSVTILLALIIGVILGSLAAFRPRSIFDRMATSLAVSAASFPDFWMALMGVLIFSVALHWLPTSGTGTPLHWILPLLVLIMRPLGSLVQVVRGSMIEALSSPYVEAARGRGTPPVRVIFLHALRNAAIPAITVLGVQTAGILNGAVVVETIFGWPGIGRLMINAIFDRDFAVVQAAVVVTALAIFLLNIVIDILYGVIDPRVRT
ncbi:MAG TPA: ABC transporter permease [Devosiaceae bacterium]|jgi:peptide/nickel transport system permease protein